MVGDVPSVGEVDALTFAARVDRLVAHLERAQGIGQRRWLSEALSSALRRSDPGALTPDLAARAAALGVPATHDAGEIEPPPHSVVVPCAAGPLGLARRVHAGFDLEAADEAGGFEGTSRDAARHALRAAAQRITPPHPIARYHLVPWLPGSLAWVTVDGDSLGAATYVSAVALWSGRAVRAGTAVSAALVGASVGPVGGLAAKVDALLARADVTRLVVAEADRAQVESLVRAAGGRLEVVGAGSTDALLVAALAAPDAVARGALRGDDVDHVVYEARRAFAGGWSSYRWPALRERLERVAGMIPAGRPDLEVAALTMLGAARRHLGAPEESARVLARAEALAAAHAAVVPDPPLVHLHEHVALTRAMLGDLREARVAAQRAVRIAARARLSAEQVKALGTLGLVELAAGRCEAAAAAQARALALGHAGRPAHCARTCGYLAEACGRAGDLAGARAAWAEGRAHLAASPEAGRDVLEAWLRVNFGAALVRCGAPEEAVETLAVPVVAAQLEGGPLPGLLARRALGLALVRRPASSPAEIARGLELLAQSPAAHGQLAAPRFLAMAQANVLHEARARLALGRWESDIEARAVRALGSLPRYGRVSTRLAPLALRVHRALAEADARPAPLARALDTLLARTERFGL